MEQRIDLASIHDDGRRFVSLEQLTPMAEDAGERERANRVSPSDAQIIKAALCEAIANDRHDRFMDIDGRTEPAIAETANQMWSAIQVVNRLLGLPSSIHDDGRRFVSREQMKPSAADAIERELAIRHRPFFPCASVPLMPDAMHVVLDLGAADGSTQLAIWVKSPEAVQYVTAGEFWVAVAASDGGSALWMRLTHQVNALNRAMFALAEVRKASAGAPLPPGPWLPFSTPRREQS